MRLRVSNGSSTYRVANLYLCLSEGGASVREIEAFYSLPTTKGRCRAGLFAPQYSYYTVFTEICNKKRRPGPATHITSHQPEPSGVARPWRFRLCFTGNPSLNALPSYAAAPFIGRPSFPRIYK